MLYGGAHADILWAEAALLVRRSETRGEVMERTKTGRRLRIADRSCTVRRTRTLF